MHTLSQHPLPDPGALTPGREQPEPAREQDFAERHDDPEQAEELERQQDA